MSLYKSKRHFGTKTNIEQLWVEIQFIWGQKYNFSLKVKHPVPTIYYQGRCSLPAHQTIWLMKKRLKWTHWYLQKATW